MPEEQNDKKTTLFRETTERFWLLQLISEVREDGIYVRLGPLQRSFQRIRPGAIRDVTVTTYAATAYAGWHWGVRKTPGGNTVYRLRGNRGRRNRIGKRKTLVHRFPTPRGARVRDRAYRNRYRVTPQP